MNCMKYIEHREIHFLEQLDQIEEALDIMDNGDILTVTNDFRPYLLYDELDSLGYPHVTEQLNDGSYKITIMKQNK